MRRRLFHISAMISLLMFGLVGLFWGRSYLWGDNIEFYYHPRTNLFWSYDGVFMISTGTMRGSGFAAGPGWFVNFRQFGRGPNDLSPNLGAGTNLGFGYEHLYWNNSIYKGDLRRITAPFWFPATIFAILPLIALRRWIRKRNRNPFACIACGYDLRATPDRCPECGAVPKIKPPEPRTQ